MKRPPPIPEWSAAPRRKRSLSEEERALWESIAKQVKPLRKRPRTLKALMAPMEGPPVAAKSAVVPNPRPAKVPRPDKPPPLAPLGRRERSQLSRGRKEIDARIDLHGMTQAEAHGALRKLLHRSQASGAKFVLVVTGKGAPNASRSDRGVLRRQVPMWLALPEFRRYVLGFDVADTGHGGEGALYVRLRKAKV